jgi:hypothetical protein
MKDSKDYDGLFQAVAKLRENRAKNQNFLQTVAHMRQAQKNYFKTKSQDALIESKRLEAAVDKGLKEFNIEALPK